MRQPRPFLATLSLAFLLIAACNGGGLGPTTPGGVTVEGVEFNSFQLVNGARLATRSDSELGREDRIARIARTFSEEMRDQGFFSHLAPDGTTLQSRLRSAGIEFRSAAENLARVTNVSDPATFAHTLLMQQEEHRANILNPRYELLGVGVAKSDGTVWITQIFIEN